MGQWLVRKARKAGRGKSLFADMFSMQRGRQILHKLGVPCFRDAGGCRDFVKVLAPKLHSPILFSHGLIRNVSRIAVVLEVQVNITRESCCQCFTDKSMRNIKGSYQIYKNVKKRIKSHTGKMLPKNSLSKLTRRAGHSPFLVNVGTGIIAQINYSLLPHRKV